MLLFFVGVVGVVVGFAVVDDFGIDVGGGCVGGVGGVDVV